MRSEHLASSGHAFDRGVQWPACPRCGDMLLAAVSSVLVERDHIRHSWSCDSCGYGFRTAIRLRAIDRDETA
jgi:hypothetical protein